MIVKDERIIKFSADQVEETLITQPKVEEDNMETAKVKMEEVREENERLKLTLSQMMKDYHSLKRQFNGKIQEDDDHDEQFKKLQTSLGPMAASDESELVSLSLGRFSADTVKKTSKTESKNLEICKLGDGLELGLDYKPTDQVSMILNPGNSSDESKEDETNDVGSSRKNSRSEDDEILQHNPLKKPRVSVRAVCNTQTMHDGCQWRKYGQKISKGNPCPRAYYRCTVSPSCPVRKQVQRCMEDMRILITTYEGTHNHPLPASATNMASTTSAAAAMLNCGSSASPPYHGGSAATSAAASPNHFGYNYASPNNLITFSSSQSHPTVILDLTAPSHNNKFSSTSTHSSLNFSSSNSCYDLKYPGINNISSPYSQPSLYTAQKQAANDQKIAAATKAITSDPSFQSALADAITSFVGSNSVHGRNSGLNSHLKFSQPSTSFFLKKFPHSVNSQQILTHFAPLSASKSQPISSAEENEDIKLL